MVRSPLLAIASYEEEKGLPKNYINCSMYVCLIGSLPRIQTSVLTKINLCRSTVQLYVFWPMVSTPLIDSSCQTHVRASTRPNTGTDYDRITCTYVPFAYAYPMGDRRS